MPCRLSGHGQLSSARIGAYSSPHGLTQDVHISVSTTNRSITNKYVQPSHQVALIGEQSDDYYIAVFQISDRIVNRFF